MKFDILRYFNYWHIYLCIKQILRIHLHHLTPLYHTNIAWYVIVFLVLIEKKVLLKSEPFLTTIKLNLLKKLKERIHQLLAKENAEIFFWKITTLVSP